MITTRGGKRYSTRKKGVTGKVTKRKKGFFSTDHREIHSWGDAVGCIQLCNLYS